MSPKLERAVENAVSPRTQATSLALSVGTDQVRVDGKDVVGGTLPVLAHGVTTIQEFTEGRTYGRIVRLRDSGTSDAFYDIGIDKDGELFINSKDSTQSKHVLTISPSGEITLNARAGLRLSGLADLAGRGIVGLVFDKYTGELGHDGTSR